MSFPVSQDAGQQPRTLYVGNLDPGVTEELMAALFGQIGVINACKIIQEPGNTDPYCFIEFESHADASRALAAMNQRKCLGRELRVNWASSAVQQQHPHRPDTSRHHHIFIGDLSPQIETSDLREVFSPFGEISDCRVVKDPATQKSRGYGFVSFTNRQDAENAIQTMNGSWLGSRAIRTNWATRKPPTNNDGGAGDRGGGPYTGTPHHRALNYDDVFVQSSASNFTVYCGGLNQVSSSEDILRQAFDEFGEIVDVRVFKDKGYAFIKFSNKESACHAIVARHNTEICGQLVKCSWGREQEAQQQQQQQPQYPYDPYQMNYWYSGYPLEGGQYMNAMYPAAAAAAAAAPAYGQYYGQYPMAMQVPQGPPGAAMPYPPQQYPSQ